MSDRPHSWRSRCGRPAWRGVLAPAAALQLIGCAPSDEAVADPFEPTGLPQFELLELAEVGRDTEGSQPLLNKVTAAVFVNSREMAVASDEGEILVFGVQGEFLRRLGRRGEGPGEFQFIQDVVRLNGDRILAWDPALDRVTVFTRDGRLDFTCTPTWALSKQAGVGFVGAFADGRFVLEDMSFQSTGESVPDGLRSDTIPYFLFDRTGVLVRRIGELVRRPRYYEARTGYRRFLFASSVRSRIVGGELYVGENDSIVLQRFDSTGAAHTTLTLDRGPRRVTELDIEAGWRAWAAQIAVQQKQLMAQTAATWGEGAAAQMQRTAEEALARAKESTEPAEFLPAYESIVVGSDQTLWFQDYLHPTEEVSRWFLMGDDLQPVGWIELRPNERLLAAGPGRLIVLRKDELEIESVVVYGGEWSRGGGAQSAT